jgi:hypothetical protein
MEGSAIRGPNPHASDTPGPSLWGSLSAAAKAAEKAIEAGKAKARTLDEEYKICEKASAAASSASATISAKATEAEIAIRAKAAEARGADGLATAEREARRSALAADLSPQPGQARSQLEPEPEPSNSLFGALRHGVGNAFVSLGELVGKPDTGGSESEVAQEGKVPAGAQSIACLPAVPVADEEPMVVTAVAVDQYQPAMSTASVLPSAPPISIVTGATRTSNSLAQPVCRLVQRHQAGFGLTIDADGVLIDAVSPDLAGIPLGSVVVAIGAVPMRGRNAILTALGGVAVGQAVTFEFLPAAACIRTPDPTSAPSGAGTGCVGRELWASSNSGVWRAAVVVAERHNAVLIHYVGFDTAYDEWLGHSSSRIGWEGPPVATAAPSSARAVHNAVRGDYNAQGPAHAAANGQAIAAGSGGGSVMAALATGLFGAQAMQDMRAADQLRRDLGLTTDQALKYGQQACYVATELGITPANAFKLCQSGVQVAQQMGVTPAQAAAVISASQQHGGAHVRR